MRFFFTFVALLAVLGCSNEKSRTKTGIQSRDDAAVAERCVDLDSCRRICEACTGACNADQTEACHRQAQLQTASVGWTFDMAAIARLYEKACHSGKADACAALAIHYVDGRGKRHDPAMAVSIASGACEKGSGVACFNLGLWARVGLVAKADEAKAAEYMAKAVQHYRAACDRGELVWCMNLGVVYEQGFAGTRDVGRAEKLYRDACTRGHADSCVNLALVLLSRAGEASRAPEAMSLLEKSCSGSSPLACGVLGKLYFQQRYGIPRDRPKALGLLERGCNGGAKQACGLLAAIHFEGVGGPRDVKQGLLFGHRACLLGDPESCFAMADVVKAVPEGRAKMREFLERACNIGHARACVLVASSYSGAFDIPPDPLRAARARARACRLGSPHACGELVRMKIPLPLPADRAESMRAQLCNHGVREACR